MRQHGSVVDQVASGEVVGAVDDQVVLAEQGDGIVGRQPFLVRAHGHQWVEFGDRIPALRALDRPMPEVPWMILSLQVGLLDHIVIDDPQGAHPGRSQVEEGR